MTTLQSEDNELSKTNCAYVKLQTDDIADSLELTGLFFSRTNALGKYLPNSLNSFV